MLPALELAASSLVTALRFGAGGRAHSPGKRPAIRLEIYEFEACPFCRKAREALSMLDLDATVYPCPKGGMRYRPRVKQMGGRAMFPYLVDPNADVRMYESMDIVRYLFATYGDGHVPASLAHTGLATATSSLASAVRSGRGTHVRPSRMPDAPLELYSSEGSPAARLVREELCTLELSYVLHNVPAGSAKRDALAALGAGATVPWLVDPNTGASVGGAQEAMAYLRATYAIEL